MATNLTDPINERDIYDRFEDLVANAVPTTITWGTDNKPFTEISDTYFGGTTAGRSMPSGMMAGNRNYIISASQLYDALLDETKSFSQIRSARIRKTITGQAGYAYDSTANAYLSTSYPSVSSVASTFSQGDTITSNSIVSFIDDCRDAYVTGRATTVTIDITVCHTSCHTSCHGSRGRR